VVRLEADTGPGAKTRKTARPGGAKDHTPIDNGAVHRQDCNVAISNERDPTESSPPEQSPTRVLVELVHHDLVFGGHQITSDAESNHNMVTPTMTQAPGANVPTPRSSCDPGSTIQL
jgi:hypothetical protein